MSENSDTSDGGNSTNRHKRKQTSWVWNHFTKVQNNTKGQCKYCEKQFAIGVSAATGKDKGTKSLSDHIKAKHAMEPAVSAAIEINRSTQDEKKKQSSKRSRTCLLRGMKCL